MAAKKSTASQPAENMSNLTQEETEVYLLDEDLEEEFAHPYCKLPEHYFDLLLYKKGATPMMPPINNKAFDYTSLR